MFGIFLLYFIGKHFYKLAEDFDKSKWGYVILGIAIYYVTAFLSIITLELIFIFVVESYSLENTSDTALGLLAMPFGILGCYGLHWYLKKYLQIKANNNKKEIDDIGLE